MKVKISGVFCLLISMLYCVALKSAKFPRHEIRELNMNDPQEIMQTCSLFKDPDISSGTFMHFDGCMDRLVDRFNKKNTRLFKPEAYKIFISKTIDEKPEVSGVLMCQYLAGGQYPRISSMIGWQDGMKQENKEDDAVEFRALGVDQNYRRQGIATKLMQAAQDACVAQNVPCIRLTAYTTAQEAIAAYAKFGFTMPLKISDDATSITIYKKI